MQEHDLISWRKNELPNDGDSRDPFQRDVHRIIYSDAFRRLRHKTQVFFLPLNDHICTRLEHVLYVAEAAYAAARELEYNVDLTRAIALAHDIGHAPFGHHGETVLDKILSTNEKSRYKGFSHEINGLRVVDKIARLDRKPCGLNLTLAVRDGIVSHCGENKSNNLVPITLSEGKLERILATNKKEVDTPSTVEGCLVRIVDKIAYAGKDIEDAITAELIDENKINKELKDEIEVLGKVNGDIVGRLLSDLVQNSNANLVMLSKEKDQALQNVIKWNDENIYKHPSVQHFKLQAERGISVLFDELLKDMEKTHRFTENMDKLPRPKGGAVTNIYELFKGFIHDVGYDDTDSNVDIVVDFIAGMTDHFLIRSIKHLFLPEPII